MRGIAIAVSLAYLGEEGGLVIDPTNVEESKAESRFVFAWAFGSGMSTEEKGDMEVDDEDIEAEIVWTETEGDFTRDQVSLFRVERFVRPILMISLRPRFKEGRSLRGKCFVSSGHL